jgi:hypothetical protein
MTARFLLIGVLALAACSRRASVATPSSPIGSSALAMVITPGATQLVVQHNFGTIQHVIGFANVLDFPPCMTDGVTEVPIDHVVVGKNQDIFVFVNPTSGPVECRVSVQH